MITGITEAKTLKKHISCECQCKFDGTKCKSNQSWNNKKCHCDCKKHHICEKDYEEMEINCNGNVNVKMENIENSILDDSVSTCDDVIESYDEKTKTIPTNFNEKNITCETQSFNVLLTFLLITIAVLIAVNIYCYMIKYRAKQKHLFPFHDSKLKQFCVGSIN